MAQSHDEGTAQAPVTPGARLRRLLASGGLIVAPGVFDGLSAHLARRTGFWAAYLMTTDKRGLSALLLQRQLALVRYETAWMMLHKFRRAMINLKREPLRGEVEVDDTWVGGPQPACGAVANSRGGKRR